MISDSVPWKEELLKVASRLEKKKVQTRWAERSSFLVERDVMVGAYAVRRLNEAHKISDKLAARRLKVKSHALIGGAPDVLNRFEFWEHYDLEKSEEVELSVREFCNQVIHSWNWHISATDESPWLFNGIFISSDRKRRSCLYFIDVDMLVELFRSVGNEDIVSADMRRNSDGEMIYINLVGAPWGELGGM